MSYQRYILSMGAALLLAGCASYQSSNSPNGYDHYTEFMSEGKKYTRCAMAYPTGQLSSSKVYLEKTVPSEVGMGKEFEFQFRLKNLTHEQLRDLVISDTLPGKFRVVSSSPQANVMPDGTAQWVIPVLEGQKEQLIRIVGVADQVGIISSCGSVSYDSQICATTKVVKAELHLTVSQPAQATLCDQIPVTYTVTNTGSTTLSGVSISSQLPTGLVTLAGASSANLPVGDLTAGQTKQLVAAVKATRTGTYPTTGVATTADGLTAQASASTIVHAANLVLTASAPDQLIQNKTLTFNVSVTNNGDMPARGLIMESQIPLGSTNVVPNNGGQVVGDKILWRLDELAENKVAKVSASFRPAAAMTQIVSSVKGDCVNTAESLTRTSVEGVGAIMIELKDEPDPIEVGQPTTYTIRVTNQGNAPESDIQLTCSLEDAVAYVSANGASAATVSADKKVVTFAPYATIPPKQFIEYAVVVKGVSPADTRFKVSMKTAGRNRPVNQEEATRVY